MPMKVNELRFKMRKKRNIKERRCFPRIAASEVISHSAVAMAMGKKVELINFNLNGAILIRSEIALAPNSPVQMRLEIPGSSLTFGGHIHRCRIIGIGKNTNKYEAAIIFDEKLPLPFFSKARKLVFDRSPSASLFLQRFQLDKTA
jgi:hypothetical protein